MGIIFLFCVFSYLGLMEIGFVFLRIFFPRYLAPRFDDNVRFYCRTLVRFARFFYGLKFEISLPPNSRLPDRFIVLSNHQSLIDIVALIAAFRQDTLLFVAKKELGRGIPAASRVLRMQGHALIDRSYNLVDTARELRKFSKRAEKAGSSIAIFPEGTRSRDGKLGEFNAGAYRIVQTGNPLPTLVLAVDGGYQLHSFNRISTGRGARYRLKLVDILPAPGKKSEIQEGLDRSRELIKAQVQAWRTEDGAAPC